MITWTPDGALPLVEAQEDEVNVVATVTAESDADPVESLTWEAVPVFPAQFNVAVAVDTLTLTIPDFVGFFPIQEIRYLRNGVEGSCTAWADLPVDAEDVIAYRPSAENMREHILSVTAEPDGVTQDFVIRVWANYSLGRDALSEAVDARRL